MSNVPSITVMFTNADQLTSDKNVKLTTIIDREKPMVVAVCEVKPKKSGDSRQLLDYSIPGYSLHPVNLEDDTGRGID